MVRTPGGDIAVVEAAPRYQGRVLVRISPYVVSRYETTEMTIPPGSTSRPAQATSGLSLLALRNEILRTEVGSGVHGMAIEGTDDTDYMGIYIEPKVNVYGLAPAAPHFVWRTQPEGVRSGPDDVDLTCYSLRKYIRMALDGHPTVLLPLFAPESAVQFSSPLGRELRAVRHQLLSQLAITKFLGYLRQQYIRMNGGGKQNRLPNRPELIAAYGWDVKYGAHALRLAYQGLEVASDGTLTLPIPEERAEQLRAVKLGEVPQAKVAQLITLVEQEILTIQRQGTSPLPAEPDYPAIQDWVIAAHEQWWKTTRQ